MKSEQNLNAEKQNFESTNCFKGSECKRFKVAEVDLLAYLSSDEHSGPWAFRLFLAVKPQWELMFRCGLCIDYTINT